VSTLRILVIDDEEQVRESLKLLLEFDGHLVDTAENGARGFELICAQDYDVVFTDFVMPVMQGDVFARKVKEAKPLLTVIMITAHVNSSGFLKAPPGVDFVLGKPFLLEDLRGAIRLAMVGKTRHSSAGFTSTVVP